MCYSLSVVSSSCLSAYLPVVNLCLLKITPAPSLWKIGDNVTLETSYTYPGSLTTYALATSWSSPCPRLTLSGPCFLFFLAVGVYSPALALSQLSTEMYDVNQQGDCYYEVFLRFMENTFDRWRELDVTHHLTVVFFCRTHFCSNKVCLKREVEAEKAVNPWQVGLKMLRGTIERVVRILNSFCFCVFFYFSGYPSTYVLVIWRGWNSSRRRLCVSPSRIFRVIPTIHMQCQRLPYPSDKYCALLVHDALPAGPAQIYQYIPGNCFVCFLLSYRSIASRWPRACV